MSDIGSVRSCGAGMTWMGRWMSVVKVGKRERREWARGAACVSERARSNAMEEEAAVQLRGVWWCGGRYTNHDVSTTAQEPH